MKWNLESRALKTSRRSLLRAGMLAAVAPALAAWSGSAPQEAARPQEGQQKLPEFTGPEPNPYWNSVGPFATEPQKSPLILLTDRPVQLETPRQYFLTPFTPNDAFYVRWHLETLPNAIELKEWRLGVEGNIEKPLALSLPDLFTRFKTVSVAAVNQCSGNSRSRFQPRVAGGQWGNGAMGNAVWTGVKLRDVLEAAKVKSG
jgi:DMSO/TMAO reductase YedYZ molybdopterin-dependent catalytic subunit